MAFGTSPGVPKYETKLKLGRKISGVESALASDNQVSVLFRYDEGGHDRHVSLGIESDTMTADDVAAVLAVLDQRGLFTRHNSKTWVSQPQASIARFGETRDWADADVYALAARLSSFIPSQMKTASKNGDDQGALARLREAQRRVAELERSLVALKGTLDGAAPAE